MIICCVFQPFSKLLNSILDSQRIQLVYLKLILKPKLHCQAHTTKMLAQHNICPLEDQERPFDPKPKNII